MSDNEMEMGEFSLADLAEIDTSDVEEIRFESLPPGAYGFKVVDATLGEKPNRDNEKRFTAAFKLEVVEVKSVVKKGVEPDSLIGKTHTETLYIVPTEGPQKLAEGIGRVRAFITDMGAESAGQFNEVLDALTDHTFYGKITERPNPQDPSQKFARLKLDSKKR